MDRAFTIFSFLCLCNQSLYTYLTVIAIISQKVSPNFYHTVSQRFEEFRCNVFRALACRFSGPWQ